MIVEYEGMCDGGGGTSIYIWVGRAEGRERGVGARFITECQYSLLFDFNHTYWEDL